MARRARQTSKTCITFILSDLTCNLKHMYLLCQKYTLWPFKTSSWFCNRLIHGNQWLLSFEKLPEVWWETDCYRMIRDYFGLESVF